MIKLHWYALTKPHVVHRYYRIKEKPIVTPMKTWVRFHDPNNQYLLELPNNWRDKEEYMTAASILMCTDSRMKFPALELESRILDIIKESSIKFYRITETGTQELWLNTK